MLHIEPLRWFSWDFSVDRDGRRVAELDISWWRERGELAIEGTRYAVSREGLLSGDFRLAAPDGRLVATASKPSAFQRRFEIVHGGRTWALQARSAWRRTMDLSVEGRSAGAITPTSIWSRRATANLPAALPLPVQVFVVWLTVLLWKRDDEAAAAS